MAATNVCVLPVPFCEKKTINLKTTHKNKNKSTSEAYLGVQSTNRRAYLDSMCGLYWTQLFFALHLNFELFVGYKLDFIEKILSLIHE